MYSTMKKIIIIILIISSQLSLLGCKNLYFKYILKIAPDRFTFEEEQTILSIPMCSSHPLVTNSHQFEYSLIMIHGGGLTAKNYFELGQQVVNSLKIDKNRILVLAPQFLEKGVDIEEKGLLFWDQRWRGGGKSLSINLNKDLPELSSYEVLDRLINVVTKQNPRLRRIIILGHSAGGQFVSRYAAVNNRHESLEKQGIFIHYVVANPSSYLYLDGTRYQVTPENEFLKMPKEKLTDCPGYNKYKYGLEDLYGYAENLPPHIVRTRLLTRPVMFVLGTADTDRGWSQDKSCEADVQGKNRYERGLLYKHHLRSFVKSSPKFQHIWLEIPEVGHEATEIFTHPRFITELKTLDF